MNDKIKEILVKHGIYNADTNNCINNALIEICELQKQECAKVYTLSSNQKKVLKRKNIAE